MYLYVMQALNHQIKNITILEFIEHIIIMFNLKTPLILMFWDEEFLRFVLI